MEDCVRVLRRQSLPEGSCGPGGLHSLWVDAVPDHRRGRSVGKRDRIQGQLRDRDEAVGALDRGGWSIQYSIRHRKRTAGILWHSEAPV